jgi:hypothetical protein
MPKLMMKNLQNRVYYEKKGKFLQIPRSEQIRSWYELKQKKLPFIYDKIYTKESE